jgi:hypothetical protein
MKLWHDDVRPPPDSSWRWARTNDDAKAILETGTITECSLDHDLGLHGVEIPDDPDELMDLIYQVGPAAETGLDLVHWMVEHKHVPKVVRIHSWNPAGAQNMAARLNRFGHDCIVDPYKVPT